MSIISELQTKADFDMIPVPCDRTARTRAVAGFFTPKFEDGPMEERFVDMTELPARLGICKRSISYLREHGKFPQPRQITKQRIGWLESEVLEWMRARPVVGGGNEGMQ